VLEAVRLAVEHHLDGRVLFLEEPGLEPGVLEIGERRLQRLECRACRSGRR
jgi:hypothetical protein